MFDFCFIISREFQRIKHNELHEKYLAGIPYISSQVYGKHFAGELFYHTDLPENSSCKDGSLYCSLLGKVYSNNKYNTQFQQNLKQLYAKDIIALYQSHTKDFIQYVKGLFLVVVFDEDKRTYLAYTSKSGLYRLYYAHVNNCLMISSSISSIINNLNFSPPLDDTALIQHGMFEYTLGERTFYQGINVVDNSNFLQYDLQRVELRKYYELESYLNSPPKFNWSDTLDLIPDQFNKAMDTTLLGVDKCNAALTGGYDSRTILSYLLKRKIRGFRLYTWAANRLWEDVVVANNLAKVLNLTYDSIELGKEMLESYQDVSDKQIYWTDGSGSINRSNQMYSHGLLARYARDLITGYFGSELFRPLHRSNVMIKERFIDITMSNKLQKRLEILSTNVGLSGFQKSYWDKHKTEFIDASIDYFSTLNVSVSEHVNLFNYLVKTGFWKFFGQEFHAQRIHTRMSSPFIDDDFIQFLAQTPIVGIQKASYKKHGLKSLKGQAIYHPIILNNCPELMKYLTNRGFAPKDYKSITYPLNIIVKHQISKRKQQRLGVMGFDSKTWNQDVYRSRALLMKQEDSIFAPIDPDKPTSGFWYSLKLYLTGMKS